MLVVLVGSKSRAIKSIADVTRLFTTVGAAPTLFPFWLT
jgi:hypothetical protein